MFCFKTLALSGTSHTNKRILKESYLTGCNRSLLLLLPLTRQHFSVLKLKTFITKSVDRKWSKSHYLIRLSSFIKLSSVERVWDQQEFSLVCYKQNKYLLNDTFISISPEIVLLSLAGTWLEQQIPYNRGTWFPEAVSEGIKNSIFKPLKCVYKLEAN